MADQKRVGVSSAPADSAASYEMTSDVTSDFEQPANPGNLPKTWKYRQLKIGKFASPYYASPKFQLGMVAIVCFLCPGMFNALGGMGGAGLQNPTLSDHMNVALYSTFAVFGFFGGTFVNVMGVRATLGIGGFGYCLYCISLRAALGRTEGIPGFNIPAGAVLGVCAGLLWTAQGTIMTSYPNENAKGRYFAWFWTIFNMGAVIGSLVPLGLNMQVKTNSDVSGGTYVTFIILMALGCAIGSTVCNARDVIREDGSRIILMKNPTWQSEFVGLWETIRHEPLVLLLFPMFWSSNWFYTYQQNGINALHFTTRTKALNSCLYFLAQIVGALLLGYALDYEGVRRSVRAKISLALLFVMTMVIWGGGYAWQKTYTRASVAEDGFDPTDWSTPGYVAPMFLYIFYGFYDSIWQATVYWYMGALSNSGRKTANYIGFYKGLQSAGAAVMWSLDARKLSLMTMFASNWILLVVSLVCAAPVIIMKIKDHVPVEEDLAGTGETLDDVLPAGHADKTEG